MAEQSDIQQQISNESLHSTPQDQVHLALIDAELARLQAQIEDCEDQRTRLLADVAYNTNISKPVAQLPFEILGVVFFQYIEADDHPTPATLFRVCHQWREVAYGTPSIWSRVLFAPGHLKKLPPRFAAEFIRRAGAFPLAFEFDLTHAYPNTKNTTQETTVIKIRELVDEHVLQKMEARNVRSIDIIAGGLPLNTKCPWAPILSILPILLLDSKAIPKLISFRIRSSGPLFRDIPQFLGHHEEAAVAEAFSFATSLTTMEIPRHFIPPNHSVFKNITDLKLQPQTNGLRTGMIPILRNCAALRSLSVTFGDFEADTTEGQEPFALPFLQYLWICLPDCVDAFLKAVRLPQLKTLVLDNMSPGTGNETLLLPAMKEFAKFTTGLETLVLREACIPEATLIWTLQHLPTLEMLVLLECTKVSRRVIEALEKQPLTIRKGWLCPNLKALVVSRAEGQNIDTKLMKKLVQARTAPEPQKCQELHRRARLEMMTFGGRDLIPLPENEAERDVVGFSAFDM